MKAPAGLPGGFFGKKARDILNPSPDSFDNGTNVGGNDLLAWNINRGRDHGLPRKNINDKFFIITHVVSNFTKCFLTPNLSSSSRI